ncbi:MAG TPA: hypothetical protein VF546_18105 [Pyrinomonadaceae bacterium]|jgi:hypothetical protein
MRKYLALLALSLIVGTLTGGLAWHGRQPLIIPEIGAAAMPGEVTNLTGDLIDEKARKVIGPDETAIRELADEVFASSHFGEIPASALEKIKERAIAHEVKYRQGHKGINEKTIVKMINELADKVGAPEYAKTSPFQVHALRARLMFGYPNFISPLTADKKRGLQKKLGTSMNPELSPLEAVFVAGVLLEQKLINAEFQYSPEEWADKLKKKELKNWQAAELRRRNRAQVKPQLAVSSNPKAGEMRAIIAQVYSKVSPGELIRLADDSLDTLGIER